MAVVLIKDIVSQENLVKAQEEYGEYVKVDIDLVTELMTIGGEWHADGEKVLLKNGSKQGDIWGGGVNLGDNSIDYNSMINIKPDLDNNSQEILDKETRDKFSEILKRKFKI